MLKKVLICTLFIAVAVTAVKIHEYDHHEYLEQAKYEPEHEETEHHHEVEHKHATSHQSVKFHHFHAVPVYIKKEDQHLLKKPIEIGGTKHKLKILHPETELAKNYGAVLESHSESHVQELGHYEEPQHHQEHYEHYHHE